VKAQSLPLNQAVVRLEGQYGKRAIVADLAGLGYEMRGDDVGFQSDRLQIWYNNTEEAWVDPLPHAHQERDCAQLDTQSREEKKLE
jgi:hypothetical protein